MAILSEDDLYDPEYLKRRNILLPGADQVMAPDSEDSSSGYEDELPASQTMSYTPTTSPAQERYRRVLSNMPRPMDYAPSRGRRIGAIIAGGLAGASGGAKTGYNIGQAIVRQPYNMAMEDWQNQIKREYESAKIDEMAAKQGIAAKRAQAYQVGADARMKAANATEAWRLWQQEHNVPEFEQYLKDPERYKEFQKMRHPEAQPPKPTAFQEYLQDPENYGKFKNLTPKEGLTREDRLKIETDRERGRNTRHAQDIAERQSREGTPSTPGQQEQAEEVALSHLIRSNPEYSDFIHPPVTASSGTNAGKVIQGPRAKTLEEAMSGLKGSGFFGGVSESQKSLAREKYRQFLSDLDKKKVEIMGKKAPNKKGQWSIQEED